MLIVPLCVVLQSTLQIIWQVEKQQWITSFTPFAFSIQLQSESYQFEADAIVETIASIEGMQTVYLDRSIPAWDGPQELAPQWEQVWENYMPYFVFASTEPHVKPLTKLENIASQLEAISGVASVEWDQERYFKLKRLFTSMQRQGNVLYYFFSVWLILICLILLWYRPHVFFRRNAVQNGLLGAGSQISPEWILGKLVALHGLIAALLYCGSMAVIWLLLLFPVSWDHFLRFQFIWLEGLLTSITLSIAVIIAGWWLPLAASTENPLESYYYLQP